MGTADGLVQASAELSTVALAASKLNFVFVIALPYAAGRAVLQLMIEANPSGEPFLKEGVGTAAPICICPHKNQLKVNSAAT